MEAPSDAIRTLLIKKKKETTGKSDVQDEVAFFRPNSSVSSVETTKRARPEDAVPDYPQNHVVREFLRKAGNGQVALGEGVVLNQCWRCKLFGHRTGDRDCPYFNVGNLEAEAERQVREDPLMAIAPQRLNSSEKKDSKLQELQELLRTVKQAEEERKRNGGVNDEDDEKKRKKKKKRKTKEKKKRKKRSKRDGNDGVIVLD
jgi:retinitis pigmentosa 9 protein